MHIVIAIALMPLTLAGGIAAAESAARGGGLLGGIGFIPVVLGYGLAVFSVVVLLLTGGGRRETPDDPDRLGRAGAWFRGKWLELTGAG